MREPEPAGGVPAAGDAADADAVLELMGSARAMRHLRGDPVPSEVVDRLLWAATRASSPDNSQLWHLVAVEDREQRRRVAGALSRFGRWIDRVAAPPGGADGAGGTDGVEARRHRSSRHLLRSLADAPLLVVVCGEDAFPSDAPDPAYLWSTLGGAAQNLLLAARAHGLGATLTMFHVLDEAAVAEVLRLPDGVRIGSIVPVGWPDRPFGPVRRRPMSEVVHRDQW